MLARHAEISGVSQQSYSLISPWIFSAFPRIFSPSNPMHALLSTTQVNLKYPPVWGAIHKIHGFSLYILFLFRAFQWFFCALSGLLPLFVYSVRLSCMGNTSKCYSLYWFVKNLDAHGRSFALLEPSRHFVDTTMEVQMRSLVKGLFVVCLVLRGLSQGSDYFDRTPKNCDHPMIKSTRVGHGVLCLGVYLTGVLSTGALGIWGVAQGADAKLFDFGQDDPVS